ncbi:SDR family oxidoreductase [Paraburkholderia sp. BCC1885]|uniref:SDR family oxidoreductase n=1 Tax=Paraburkholderia sp. BCC1885 TaxID=2562669 RepID=UPI00118459C1|nr:SDR family NAD(P)-dependent oxidoreductase [Paraburkholderia sp. BCC1885]
MKMNGRTILITGGSSGIGLEFARQLLARGNTVIVTGRRETALAEARSKLSGLQTVSSDSSNPDAIRALRETVLRDHPALDVVIQCAGLMRKLDLRKTTDFLDVTREIETNLNGTIWTNLAFLDHLRAMPEAMLVNVSSGLAFVPMAVAPIYSAAKAGLHAYTQSLRLQLKNTRIRVVELAPPATDTPLFYGDFNKVDTGGVKPMSVETMVEKAIRGMENGQTEIRPGLANVLKLLGRIAPNAAVNMTSKAAVEAMQKAPV